MSAARRPARGMTLVEILVVLVIAAVLVGLAAAHFAPEDGARLEAETNRLAMQLDTVYVEAVSSGQTVGVGVDAEGRAFSVWAWQEGRWTPLELDDGERGWRLGEARAADIRVAGRPLENGEKIVFQPDGLNPPMRLTLVLGGRRVALDSNGTGRMRVGPVGGVD